MTGSLEIHRDRHSVPHASVAILGGWVDVGSHRDCRVVIESNFAAPRVARLTRVDDRLEVACVGRGARFDGAALAPGDRVVLDPGQTLQVADYHLTWSVRAPAAAAPPDHRPALDTLVERCHLATVDALPHAGESAPSLDEVAARARRHLEAQPWEAGVERLAATRWLLDLVATRAQLPPAEQTAVAAPLAPAVERVVAGLGLSGESWTDDLGRIRERGEEVTAAVLAELPIGLVRALAIQHVVDEVADQVLAFGPLTPLLRLPQIEEVMVVSRSEIYVARAGMIERTGRAFTSETACRTALDRLVMPAGRRVDVSSPLVDVRLPDGSRVNGVIPPVALRGTSITIRRFPTQILSLDDLIARSMLAEPHARLLSACVRARLNLIIAGGTGTGKTTLLGALAASIGRRERIITIEDTAELRLPHPHVVALQAVPPSAEGTGAVTIRDLVRNALRQRPDRIIVGEVRGDEAFDMVQAMSTGHDGSMSTVHANSPTDAVARLLATIATAGVIDDRLARTQLGRAIDVIVQITRLEGGRRRVTEIAALTAERGELTVTPVFQWSSGRGRMTFTGHIPAFAARVAAAAPEADLLFGWT